jgi:hypothetical protein
MEIIMTDKELNAEAKRLVGKIKSYIFFNFISKKLLNNINKYNPFSKQSKELKNIAEQKRLNELRNALNELRGDVGVEYVYYINRNRNRNGYGYHRVDGPAMQHKTDKTLDRYFLNGTEYSFEDYKTSYFVKGDSMNLLQKDL